MDGDLIVQIRGGAAGSGNAAAGGLVINSSFGSTFTIGNAYGRLGVSAAIAQAYTTGEASAVTRTDIGIGSASNDRVFSFGRSTAQGTGIVRVAGTISASSNALAKAA
jgi:hypothetical protein